MGTKIVSSQARTPYYYCKIGALMTKDKIKLGLNELVREDGLRIERLCKHGVGHPVRFTRELTQQEKKWAGVHGCDGCCSKWDNDEAFGGDPE